MSKKVKWNYAGQADVTYGEVKASPIPKIVLFLSISLVLSACILAFIFRDTLYDLIMNPKIMLTQYEVDIMYQSEFDPLIYIDRDNTLEYESFMNNDESYTYDIENTVDTNVIGDYIVKYNSNNKVKTNTIELTVHVKDMEPPNIVLINPITNTELSKTKTGEYDALIIVRDENSDSDKLGTNSWLSSDYIKMNVSDNYSDNINISYPDIPDFGNKNDGTIIKPIEYSATDEIGNTNTITLSLVIMNIDEYDNTIQQNRINELEAQLADLQNNQNNNNQQNQNTNNETSQTTEAPAINNDGTNTIKTPQISADPFTWSVSVDGSFTSSAFWIKAQNYVHYYNFDGVQAYPTSGPGMTFQPEGPGTYTIHWEASNGLSCDQSVNITE